MKKTLYVVMMFCSVVANAQGLNDGMSVDKIREKIVSTFEKAANVKTEDRYSIASDHYTIFNCSESYGMSMQSMSGRMLDDKEEGDRRLHMEEKQLKPFVDIFSSMFGECSVYCPKSYSLVVQTPKDSIYDDFVIPIDTLQMGIRLAMHKDFDKKKSAGAFGEWFSFNMTRVTDSRVPFFHSLSARYEVESECMPTEKSNAENVAEVHRIIRDFLSNEKTVKVYDIKYETDDVYAAEGFRHPRKEAVRMEGKHYFISGDREQITGKALEFVERMKVFARKTPNMCVFTHINNKRRFVEKESDEDVLRSKIFRDGTPGSKEQLIQLGFDENGLHILDAKVMESNYSTVPTKWMKIKSIRGNKVKWIEGLEP